MVPSVHTVVVCVVRGGGGPAKHGALKGVFQLFFKGDTATQWFRVHT